MGRLKLLPHWHLTNTQPAFYDLESATAVDMVAKVYGAMRELQADYNDWVDGINDDHECLMAQITKIVHDYIKMLDEKIKLQDLEIAKAVDFMTTNLSNAITELLIEIKNNGELDEAIVNAFDNMSNRVSTLENTIYTLEYEEGTENLILVKTIKEGE